jgi:hypothetical protein
MPTPDDPIALELFRSAIFAIAAAPGLLRPRV